MTDTPATAAGTAPAPEPPPSSGFSEPPVVTANEFLPEDRDLSACVGTLEKSGCGSEQRGGSSLTAVFIVMIAGMALIFTRIAIGVRKNRAGMDDT